MATAPQNEVNATTQTTVSAALVAVLVARHFWVGTAVIRLLVDLPLVFRVGGAFRL
jgi:hypothetical protein